MKKYILIAALLIAGGSLTAQSRTLKKIIELAMPGDLGSNGASVVYHPIQKKYYCAFAGNADYPLAVFDLKGKLITDTAVGFDARGMWYNSKKNTIQANGYNDFGWTNFIINKKGFPTGNEVFIAGLNQPTEQSVGIFNDKLQAVYFLKDISIVQYDLKGTEVKTIQLYPKIVAEENMGDGLPEDYNQTAIYTGLMKGEIGLLNNTDQTIELYNIATGKPTSKWQLPADAPNNTMFNFAYANGIVWLFDKGSRTWLGYK
jgi:hypothetical protein